MVVVVVVVGAASGGGQAGEGQEQATGSGAGALATPGSSVNVIDGYVAPGWWCRWTAWTWAVAGVTASRVGWASAPVGARATVAPSPRSARARCRR